MIYDSFHSDTLIKIDTHLEIEHCSKYISQIWDVDFESATLFFKDIAAKAKEMCNGYYHRDYNPALSILKNGHIELGRELSYGNMSMQHTHVESCPAFNECYESKWGELSQIHSWLTTATPKNEPLAPFLGATFMMCRHTSFATAVTASFLEDKAQQHKQLVKAALAHFTQAELTNTAITIKQEVDTLLKLNVVDEKSLDNNFPWLAKILNAA